MNLDKDKCYCNICYKNNIITELTLSKNDENFFEQPPCNHNGRYFSYLKWCNKCQDFTSHRGFNTKAICYRCVMKKNCKTAIDKGLHSCQNPETSLTNQKLHQKTIDSQIKNGTFNMMNSEVHKRATKNKMDNYQSGKCKCSKCGKLAPLDSYKICSECRKLISIENMKDKYCEICCKITPHNGRICCICHPESDVINKPVFITKNNIKFYKNEPVETVIRKLNSGEYKQEDFPGWNKRFEEWYYGSNNILTGEIDKLNGSTFYIKDNIEYCKDPKDGIYKPYEEVIENFKINSKNIVLPKEFKFIPTFREQDSINWTGAKELFERYLINKKVGWFIYIKFYINSDEQSIPLVCGKTGSRLVNSKGTDVSFSTDINDGPARRFLYDFGYEWDKTKIAIMRCNSEEETYEAESFYLEDLGLFGS